MNPLTTKTSIARFALGSMVALYHRCPHSGIVELSLLPADRESAQVPFDDFKRGPHIDNLPAEWQKHQLAHKPEWLVQFKLAATPEPYGFQVNQSLRGSPDLEALVFEKQVLKESPSGLQIDTLMSHPDGFRVTHSLAWTSGKPFVASFATFHNTSKTPLTLEYLTSFSLGRLSPFDSGEATEKLFLHRFRSQWSAEGRHERILLEDLNIERSWGGYPRRSERFGQIGSLPVRGFFPWIGLEDKTQQTFWGAQIPAPGSWQLECSRRTDKVTLSGGLPSRDYGEWWKTLSPGESFTSPPAYLAAVSGDLDDLCQALTQAQHKPPESIPSLEKSLPIVFNEWCSSWGEPYAKDLKANLPQLTRTQTEILVIDDGWAEKPEGEGIQFNGDWQLDRQKFPEGFPSLTQKFRESGLVAGLWFEMEVATDGTRAFQNTDCLLSRNGRTIQVGKRRFWDFRSPETIRILTTKVIDQLREGGFGYLKIDYNESLPAGLDGPESPGEELRKHLLGVQKFIRSIREAVPGIVIENCSSGGHRLEPSFQQICDLGSFSDAHETWSIPIIAANLHRLILPAQSQIWCVVHPDDSLSRLRYGLAATFLGRMALSGEIRQLADWQMEEILHAQQFLANCREIVHQGKSRLFRELSPSWNTPRGWQIVTRINDQRNHLLIVGHSFGNAEKVALRPLLPEGTWQVAESFGLTKDPFQEGETLIIEDLPRFSGFGVLLRKMG